MGHEGQIPPVACPLPVLHGRWTGETEAQASAPGAHLPQGSCMAACLPGCATPQPLLTGNASCGQFVVSGQKCEFQGPADKVTEAMLDTGLFNSAITDRLPDNGQGAGWLLGLPGSLRVSLRAHLPLRDGT